MVKFGVTTSNNPTEEQMQRVKRISQELSVPYHERRKQTISYLVRRYGYDGFFVVEKDRTLMKLDGQEFFWHPDTMKIRLGSVEKGLSNPLLEALNVCEGDRVLDCTLGLATDALLIARGVGPSGSVTGLEASRYIAWMTQNGLKDYIQKSDPEDDLAGYAKRIEVINTSYEEYLKGISGNPYDSIYFDPMFGSPNMKSASINAFRRLAKERSLERSDLQEAFIVADKRVVVKLRFGTGELERLKIKRFTGRRTPGGIVYGIYEPDSHGNG